MNERRQILYFDLGSPYAYLAVERAERVLGAKPELKPILLGAIMKRRGYGSWAFTEERDDRIADLQDRARRYGLPPLVWPDGWPSNGLSGTTLRYAGANSSSGPGQWPISCR